MPTLISMQIAPLNQDYHVGLFGYAIYSSTGLYCQQQCRPTEEQKASTSKLFGNWRNLIQFISNAFILQWCIQWDRLRGTGPRRHLRPRHRHTFKTGWKGRGGQELLYCIECTVMVVSLSLTPNVASNLWLHWPPSFPYEFPTLHLCQIYFW